MDERLNLLPEVASLREVADVLKTSVDTLRRAIRRGDLKAFKLARDWRLQRADVMHWLKLNLKED